MKERIKALWKLCFNDSDAFIDMYFRLRYSNEINVAIESGNEVISALQMIPYPMTFCGETIQTAYISGACTHPEYRSKGVMNQLLSQSFARMFHDNIYISTLIPAEPSLFHYYARAGYATTFGYVKQTTFLSDLLPAKDILIEQITDYQEDVYQYLDSKLQIRPCYIQHSEKDFKAILANSYIDGGMLLIAKRKQEIVGMAILSREEDQFAIQELLTEDQETRETLLNHIAQHTEYNQIEEIVPPKRNEPQFPLGMARIINAKAVLTLYAAAYPKDEMQIELTDKQLTINNGYYYLYKGKCSFSEIRLPGMHLQMTIGELTERVFEPLDPYMNLMLN